MSASSLQRWIDSALAETPPRGNSLLITVYGDAIAPHGGSILLGKLIELVKPLGLKDRQVRTCVFRLVREDWLGATPIGRRSLYKLTPAGQRRITHAYRRIYDTPDETWSGEWQLVIIPEGALEPATREALRRNLLWEGYGAIAPGVFAHPTNSEHQLREVLQESGSIDRLVLMRARGLESIASLPTQNLVQQCWRLKELADDYRRFTERFGEVPKFLVNASRATPEQCFVLRELLIHEFRRVQLRDPQLPEMLLGKKWPGHTARELCAELYERLLAPSQEHLQSLLQTGEDETPKAGETLYQRFGGLNHPENCRENTK
jgi:phenylacetic acid degradation operon negative regulatory protein